MERRRRTHAAKHDAALMLGGSVSSDTDDLIGEPCGEGHERGMTAVPQGGAGGGRTKKKDLGPLPGTCLSHLAPLPDKVQALTGYMAALRDVVERLVTVAKLSKTRPDQKSIQLSSNWVQDTSRVTSSSHFEQCMSPSHENLAR